MGLHWTGVCYCDNAYGDGGYGRRGDLLMGDGVAAGTTTADDFASNCGTSGDRCGVGIGTCGWTLAVYEISMPQSNEFDRSSMAQFEMRPQLHNQSLSLRHVWVEEHTVFGGGGTDLGAAISLTGSTCVVEAVDFVDNVQKGVGAGVIFAAASNVTVSFAHFEQNRNLGLGAGVLMASAGSRVAFSHAQFLGNVADNQMGLQNHGDVLGLRNHTP